VRARLYGAALTLFRNDGFDATTVEAVTDLADTGKGTFFNYFPTKEHVLAAYHDEMTGEILASLEDPGRGSCESAIQAAMSACADWVERDRAMARIVVQRIFGSPTLLQADLENTERFMNWFRARARDGLRSGELRQNLDLEVFLSMLAAVLSSTLNQWAVSGEASAPRLALEKRTRFLFDAARAGGRSRERSE
jgi:AcrR family transcriptional regulator